MWQWFAEHPQEEATFARAMQGRTYSDAPLVALTYPFAEVQSVCDIGGGGGGLSSEIALRHPHLRMTLFDLPGVLEQAKVTLERRQVTQRFQLQPGNFFDEIPAGHDLYILKNILHDWSDADCLRILSNCARAMGTTGRLLIVEFTVEPNSSDNLGSITDVQMMVVTDNGRERSLEEFRQLLHKAGLELSSARFTASVTLMEARRPPGALPEPPE